MNRDRQVCAGMIAVFALVAVLAIVAPFTQIPSFRLLATFGGILLGPGALACRLASRCSWAEGLAIGAVINVATVMLLGLLLVTIDFWRPISFEILIPSTTLLLSGVLLRKELGCSAARHGESRHR
jgi:hypothetical protein